MVYTKGSRGAVVRQIQARVGAQVTGAWDTATARKVAAFQTNNKVKATGQVDKETYDLLFPTKNTAVQPTKEDTKQDATTTSQTIEDEQEVVSKKPTNKTKGNGPK